MAIKNVINIRTNMSIEGLTREEAEELIDLTGIEAVRENILKSVDPDTEKNSTQAEGLQQEQKQSIVKDKLTPEAARLLAALVAGNL
jgi:hypothetical protein